jgi:hypothetical protein
MGGKSERGELTMRPVESGGGGGDEEEDEVEPGGSPSRTDGGKEEAVEGSTEVSGEGERRAS